jgi:CheY-like chemotaxis protein
MGGAITARSVEGQGSEFTLKMELAGADQALLERQDGGRQMLRPLTERLEVLLVEDNLVNQKLAVRLLERLGCDVDVAVSGPEALRRLGDRDYDLVLMDCQMPEMDGYETTRRIREKERASRRTPIVAITANAMESDLEKCIESGMDSYLTKPIDLLKLREALETWGIGETSGTGSRVPKATSDPNVP